MSNPDLTPERLAERCPRCGRFMGNRKVGLNKQWMCLRCFDKALAEIGECLSKLPIILEADDGR